MNISLDGRSLLLGKWAIPACSSRNRDIDFETSCNSGSGYYLCIAIHSKLKTLHRTLNVFPSESVIIKKLTITEVNHPWLAAIDACKPLIRESEELGIGPADSNNLAPERPIIAAAAQRTRIISIPANAND